MKEPEQLELFPKDKKPCTTPSGRTDSHGAYAYRVGTGKWRCSFCCELLDEVSSLPRRK
jgi:hypothetical protein